MMSHVIEISSHDVTSHPGGDGRGEGDVTQDGDKAGGEERSALVPAARELKDRWLEQVNGGLYLPEAHGKYEVSRGLETKRPGETALGDVRALPGGVAAWNGCRGSEKGSQLRMALNATSRREDSSQIGNFFVHFTVISGVTTHHRFKNACEHSFGCDQQIGRLGRRVQFQTAGDCIVGFGVDLVDGGLEIP